MIRLNLLPPAVRTAQLLRKIVLASVAGYVLALAWLGWKWSVGHMALVRAEREVQQVQDQLNSPSLQVAVKAVQKFADDMAAVKAKASVVNALRAQQVPLLRLLDQVPDWTLDGQVWIEGLQVQGGRGDQQQVTLQGATLSRSLFAQYYSFLDGLGTLQGLSLLTPPTLTAERGTPVIQFKLGFTVGAAR